MNHEHGHPGGQREHPVYFKIYKQLCFYCVDLMWQVMSIYDIYSAVDDSHHNVFARKVPHLPSLYHLYVYLLCATHVPPVYWIQ